MEALLARKYFCLKQLLFVSQYRAMGDFHELKLEFRRIWKPIVPGDKKSSLKRHPSASPFPPPPPSFHSATTTAMPNTNATSSNGNNDIMTPGPRFCHVGVVYDASLYIFGGYDGSNRLNDFLRFQFKQTEENLAIPPATIVSCLTAVISRTLSSFYFSYLI